MSRLFTVYFDLECRPGHWIGGDYVSKVITAAAWAADPKGVEVRTHYDFTPGEIADELSTVLEEADMVVGHFIRGFDLPLLNGELMRNDMEPLRPVLALDTKLDLQKSHGRSKSQKNLAAELAIPEPKVDVNLYEWEGFNARQAGFEEKVVERVAGDVIQNMSLRRELTRIGWLGAPCMWYPETPGKVGYRP